MRKKQPASGSSTYAFVDTCIFVRVATQGVPGCEHEALDRLRKLIQEGVLKLLVPEVVTLELERHRRTLKAELQKNLIELKTKIADMAVWNEITSVKLSLIRHAETQLTENLSSADKTLDEILVLVRGDSVIRIPLSPEILCNAERRRISGRLKRTGTKSSQDAAIIESLLHVFRRRDTSSSQLLFCSENHNDFADELKDTDKTRRFRLNPLMAEGLPATRFCVSLQELLDFDRGYEHFLDSSEEAPALEETPEPDVDEWLPVSNDDITPGAEEIFSKRVAPILPEFAKAQRERIVMDILQLLISCRSTEAWDDRSEYKLPQWLEYVPERAIPFTSLSMLAQIKRNLARYLEIHLVPPLRAKPRKNKDRSTMRKRRK